MDANTNSYYMDPGDMSFRVYTDPAFLDIKKRNIRLVPTDIDDTKEMETILYNAGFFHGFIDGEPHRLSKQKLYYYDRNPNEVVYAQYLLTKDKRYLELIRKNQLITLCKLENNTIYFPTTTLQTEHGPEKYVLAYTDRSRMPKELLDKYNGWRSVNLTFDVRCIVNETFLSD